MKSYIVTAECSESGSLHVSCREDQMKAFLEHVGFGCSECVAFQEISDVSIDDVDYFVTENGSMFSRISYKTISGSEKRECS